MDRFDRQAFDLVTGEAAPRAFDISQEDPRIRDRYGRHSWGQSTLLARRLVEAGTTFVTVHYGGWDHHWDLKAGMERYLPMVDSAVATLFDDLSQRGLLEQTLVVLCGEFSRTPRMNNGGNGGPPLSMGTPGRDHWGNAMFCLMGGGGVQGGRIVGSTNRCGEVPQDRPLEAGRHPRTRSYQVLGVDPQHNFLNHAGRPVPGHRSGRGDSRAVLTGLSGHVDRAARALELEQAEDVLPRQAAVLVRFGVGEDRVEDFSFFFQHLIDPLFDRARVSGTG